MALEQARRDHETKVQEIEKARAVLDKRSQAENARWEKQREKLETALRRVSIRRVERVIRSVRVIRATFAGPGADCLMIMKLRTKLNEGAVPNLLGHFYYP
jgi:flagellar motility protein MotE (MotC chaperone)